MACLGQTPYDNGFDIQFNISNREPPQARTDDRQQPPRSTGGGQPKPAAGGEVSGSAIVFPDREAIPPLALAILDNSLPYKHDNDGMEEVLLEDFELDIDSGEYLAAFDGGNDDGADTLQINLEISADKLKDIIEEKLFIVNGLPANQESVTANSSRKQDQDLKMSELGREQEMEKESVIKEQQEEEQLEEVQQEEDMQHKKEQQKVEQQGPDLESSARDDEELDKLPRTIVNEAMLDYDELFGDVNVILNTIDIDSSEERKFGDEPAAAKKRKDNKPVPRVELSVGQVDGRRLTARSGQAFLKYPGIPYAEPPLGELRFQRPRRKRPWSGPLVGREDVKCVQASELIVEGEEDCLVLNVWRPEHADIERSSAQSQLLPVMVWIHGGFFLFGSGDAEFQSFERLLERGVMVVSINYRLGALGFFTLGRYGSEGNNGLRDQRLALEWVQENIAAFGGDPGRVTVFGQGSGAVSAQVHLFSSTSPSRLMAGLILQSGTLLSKIKFADTTEDVIGSSERLASAFGCASEDCLRNVSAALLMKKSVSVTGSIVEQASDPESGWFWLPVLDKDFSLDPLIPEQPLQTFLEGKLIYGNILDAGGFL